MEQNNPLVSIIVITYNSSKYVLETLKSAKIQTYQNIELIVSDDCSIDDTIEICKKWLYANKNRFSRAEIISSENNTGISSNCNRGIYAATGRWLKIIAGDDMLYENSITEFVNAVLLNSSIKILVSDVAINGKLIEKQKNIDSFFLLAPKEQYKQLLKGNFLSAPSSFINRETAINLDCFDEKYPLLEDYPFFLKALKRDIKIYKIQKQLVYYRINTDNITHQKTINTKYYRSIKLFFKNEFLKELWVNKLYIHFFHYLLEYCMLNLVEYRIIKLNKTFIFLINWLSVLFWLRRIKKMKLKISHIR